MTPRITATPDDAVRFPVEASGVRRWFVCRLVMYGSPILAATMTVSLFYLALSSPVPLLQTAFGVVAAINVSLAAIGSAVATVFLNGRRGLRVTGALAYAVLSLLVYFILTMAGLFALYPY